MNVPPPVPLQLPRRSHPLFRALGLLLLLPAFFLAVVTLWIPAVYLLQTALQTGGNKDPNWLSSAPFTVAITAVRSLASVLPIVCGIGAVFLGRLGRNLVRTFFLIPALLFGPLSFGFSCFLLFSSASIKFSDPAIARALVLVPDGMLAFSVLSIVAFWLFPATRPLNDSERSSPARARIVLGLFLWLAVLASGLQAFTLSYTITNGGPAKATSTLALQSYIQGMISLALQPAARSGLLIVTLTGAIGLAGGMLLVATNFRIYSAKDQTTQESHTSCLASLSGIVLLLLVAVICSIPFAGIFWTTGSTGGLDFSLVAAKGAAIREAIGTQGLMILIWLAIVTPTAYLAALGIGALRPLGRFSEWLLLPFFPFFFVSIASLWSSYYQAIIQFHLFKNPVSVLYPLLVSVPLLTYLTFFFKGQTERWSHGDSHPNFFQAVILPSLPVTVTFAIVAALFTLRDSFWSLLTSSTFKTPALLLMELTEAFDLSSFRALILIFSLGTLVLFFPVLALLQIFVVDRLRIRAGQ